MTPSFFKGHTILITGATGTIGSEIVHQLLSCHPKAVRLFSRDEHKQFLMRQHLGDREDVRYFLGDVRDYSRLLRAMEGVDFVFHCAAYKHVPMCEYNSFEAVKTNVVGTENVIEAACEAGVKRVLLVSTDKAASPSNVMGATKLLAEKLMTSAMESTGENPIRLASVRFGNVLGSRGSVIPTFVDQIRCGGPVTITHPDMTRFFMSVSQAVQLTFSAMEKMDGGELFVLKMPVVKLGDLAEVLIQELATVYALDASKIERQIIGIRPGEKMHETLMTDEEAQNAVEAENMFIAHSPLQRTRANRRSEVTGGVPAYCSADLPALGAEEIRVLLDEFLSHERECPNPSKPTAHGFHMRTT